MTEGEAARTYGGRWRVVRPLKQGQGVATFLAADTADGRRVVVKAIAADAVSSTARHRLEHEAAVLREVSHPSIASLVELGRDGDEVYLVTPFVDGVTLAERLTAGRLPLRDAVEVGARVLEALDEVHARGILHRDVKPANVVVDADGVEHVTLIDFGLSRSSRLDPALREMPVGTARYMSPEQAGLLDRDVDHRSDLYAAGVLLFECVAGRPPFLGDGFGEVLRQHMSSRPPELRTLVPGVPRALDEIVQRLLRKDPRDRYQSAAAAAGDLRRLAAALDRGEADPALVVGAEDRRPTLTEPAFIGRAAELAALGRALDCAARGEAAVVLVEADSGGGKTRLLDELAQVGAQRGFWAARGQGVDQAAQRPFQVLEGVVEAVRSRARAEPAFRDRLQASLGEHLAAVADALPDLAEVTGSGTAGALGPETYGEARSIPALVAFLDALGEPTRPVLVLLDDAQWADGMSVNLLRRWAKEARGHVAVVVAFRSEEVRDDHALRAVAPSERIALAPLGDEEVRRLVESMAGPLPRTATDAVCRLAGGSPFMASAVLRGLVETGALVAGPDGWTVDALRLEDIQSSRHAAAVLARRLELLPGPTLRFLSVGAVLGKVFDLDITATLAGQRPGVAIAAEEEARRRHIVWARANGTACAFVHDKIREALLDRLEPEERRDLHLRAAIHLERTRSERSFEISYHFDAAGESARALPYALRAAEEARARHALEVAESQYEIAERGARDADAAVRRRVAEGLGDVLMLRGRYDDAARHLDVAARLSEGTLDRARVQGKIGELAFKRGDVASASAAIEDGLRMLGRRVPRTAFGYVLFALWEILVQAAHTIAPRAFLARRSASRAEAEFQAIRLYSRLAYAYWFQKGKVPCLWAHLREMNLAERYPPSPELAQAYSEHAPVMTMVPWFSRGLVYGERSYEIRRTLGDLWGQGQSLHFQGTVLYAASRWRETLDRCREAVRLLERTGDRWEVNTANWHVAFAHYRLGELREAVETAMRVHQAGAEIGDRQAVGISLGAWAKASGGRIPRALVHAELARPIEDVHTASEVHTAEALRLLAEGSVSAAVETLRRADRTVRARGLEQEYVTPVVVWLATALRVQAEAVPTWAPAERAAVLREAEGVARRARRASRKYPNNRPHALRESAILAAMSGRPARAKSWIDESADLAERQGAAYELGQSLQVRGQLGRRLGWEAAEEDLVRATALLRGGLHEPTAPSAEAEEFTLSLADRFESVLESGRRIASALDKAAVFAGVRDGALALLRCERCVVLKVTHDPARGATVETVSGELDADWSRSLARRALAEGRPVVYHEGAPEDASESIVLAGVRSALCAPIYVRGQAIGCFYATHRRVSGLFTDADVRLAEFLATLAGAALENAEGFQALQTAHEELKELDRLKTQLLNTASHELNTPLTPLKLQIHLLKAAGHGELTEKQRKAVGILERNVDRLIVLVQDMLDVARLQSGRLAVHLEPADLDLVARDAADAFAESARQTGVQYEVRLGTRLPVRADAKRLTQVMFNLLTNALKFTQPGGKVVVESAIAEGRAVLRVRDTGVGLTTEQMARLFQPFSQVHDPMQRTRAGSGLGLYISKGIVELHGGRIWAESDGPGHGSTFTFTVPLDEVPKMEPALETSRRETAIAKRARELV